MTNISETRQIECQRKVYCTLLSFPLVLGISFIQSDVNKFSIWPTLLIHKSNRICILILKRSFRKGFAYLKKILLVENMVICYVFLF